MEVTLNIPQEVVADLQNGTNLPLDRCLLELAIIKAYESDRITGKQVMDILGFPDRETLYQFFKANDVRSDYTLEDLQRDAANLEELLSKHGR
jgi:hypothetical protein